MNDDIDLSILEGLKKNNQIVDYHVEGNNLYISPVIPVERIDINLIIGGDHMSDKGYELGDLKDIPERK